MAYDVSGHPFLSAEARALEASDSDAIDAHVAVAVGLLGLVGRVWSTDEDLALATGAVARQVSYQLDIEPDAQRLQSVTRGARSETYRANVLLVDALAAAIIANLPGAPTLAGQYSTVTSARGRRQPAWGPLGRLA